MRNPRSSPSERPRVAALAENAPLDQRLFVLDPDRFDAFLDTLDNPPASGPKLRSLLRRVPAWAELGDDQTRCDSRLNR